MKIFKHCLLILAIFGFENCIFSQNHENLTSTDPVSLVHWISFQEALKLNESKPKPFIIDIYTSWCGWCKQMMKTTYSSQDIANYINTWFYAVKFDAESRDSIFYQGKMYYNKGASPRSTHELAIKLLDNKLMYPSTIFTNYQLNFTLNSQGYLDVKKIEPLLVYTVENIFQSSAYDEFESHFNETFYGSKTDSTHKLITHSFEEVEKLSKIKPKKILIDIYTDWCNGCRVMNSTSLTDSSVVKYLNSNFYVIRFNAESKDSITFTGHVFVNNGANNTPFHQLALALTNNSIALPTTVILDESFKKLDQIPHYLTPEMLLKIARFFGADAFKNQTWDSFLKQYTTKYITN